MTKHVLIIGTGSAGKRHAGNLAALGCKISCMDPRLDRIDELSSELDIVNGYENIEDSLHDDSIEGVVIASPPVFHVEQTIQFLKKKIPVLLEKPISPFSEDAHQLFSVQQESRTPLLMGYTWRWWRPLSKVRELLADNVVGALRNVQFMMSAHLADWHPWERYQDFFMSRKDLGGGALLDESHWIDLMYWLFGKPKTVFACIEKLSNLEIDTDDNVDMIISYDKNMKIHMHLDIYGRPHQKYIRFIGEHGSILWTVDPNRVSMSKKMENEWETWDYDCDRNDMFMGVAHEFLQMLEGGRAQTCLLNDGVNVLDFIEAARKSSREQCVVTIE